MIEDQMLAERIRSALDQQTAAITAPPGMARTARLRGKRQRRAKATLSAIGALALAGATATLLLPGSAQPAPRDISAGLPTSAPATAPHRSSTWPKAPLSCGDKILKSSIGEKSVGLSLYLAGPTRIQAGDLFPGKAELRNASDQEMSFATGNEPVMVISRNDTVVGFAPDPMPAMLNSYSIQPNGSTTLDASIHMRVCREGPTQPQSSSSPLQPGKYSITAYLIGAADDVDSVIASAPLEVTVWE